MRQVYVLSSDLFLCYGQINMTEAKGMEGEIKGENPRHR